MSAKKTTEQFIADARKVHGERYDYSLVNYERNNSKIKLICPNHGVFEATPINHTRLRSGGCVKCSPTKTMTLDELNQSLAVAGLRCESDFVSMTTNANFSCQTGHKFCSLPHNIIRRLRCPKCPSQSRPRLTYTQIKDRVKNLNAVINHHFYDEKRNCRVNVTCNVCRHEWNPIIQNIQKGSGCPRCNKNVSKFETELLELFDAWLPERNRTVLNGREIDIYFPLHKLGVEINGEYWHSEDKGKAKRYHLQKTLDAASRGVELLHFWHAETQERPEVVKSMIANKLGLSRKLYARKLELRELSTAEAKAFFNANHIQGHGNCKIAYGLFEAEDLVAAMSFGASRFSDKAEWEIIRIATKCGLNVIGGASKLLKHFERAYLPKSIQSYADKRYSLGKVYYELGFELINESSPGYFWFNGVTKVPRYKAQKHKLHKLLGDDFIAEESEVENMRRCGYSRVWDCGQMVFVKSY